MSNVTFWKRLSLLAGSFAVVAGVTAYVAWDSWSPTPAPRTPWLPAEDVEGPSPTVPEPPALQNVPRPVELGGFVYRWSAEAFEGIGGVTIRCGAEEVTTEPDGSFRLPQAFRPRTSDVRLLKQDQELGLWTRVLTGAADSPVPMEATTGSEDAPGTEGLAVDDVGSLGAEPLPEQPPWIRWTFNLMEPSSSREDLGWIRCDAVLCENWGHAARVRFQGRSGLPDGAQIAASLYFDGFRLLGAAEMPTLQEGRFEGSMLSPAAFELFSATYQLELGFSAIIQRMDRLEDWAQRYPQTQWFELDLQEETQVFVGSLAEARREDAQVEAYYRSAAEEVRRLERELRWRVEEVLDLAGGWDPGMLRRMLDDRQYPRLAADARIWDPQLLANRGAARDGWFYGGLAREGQFDEARWRHFLDAEWRPALQALIDQHALRTQEKYPEAGARLGAVLRALLDESKALSSFVVYPPGLPRHPNDFYPDEEGAGDIPRLERTIRDNSAGLERFQKLTP